MIFLGFYKAGATVKYRSNFHNDTGTIENPTSPAAEREDPAGTFTVLTAPAIVNAKTGHYGGSIDTTGFATGQHFIRMQGTVSTAKTVATEFCFQIVAFDPADAAGLGLSRVDAAVTTRMATYTQPTGFLAATFPGTVASTTNITAGTITTVTAVTGLTAANLDVAVSTRLATAGYTAPDNAGIAAIQAKTDDLTFTVAGVIDANISYVNELPVNGAGTEADPWGP
jgi:hypothetical protein